MRGAKCLVGALTVVALSGAGDARAIAPPPRRPTFEPRPQPPPPPRYSTQYATAGAWLDACVRAPRNGLNPQLDPPPPATLDAWLADLQREAQAAGAGEAARDRRRCATHVLSRSVSPERIHAFWVNMMRASRDEQARWEALYALHVLHDEQDLPLVMRQFVEAPSLRNPLAAWLRDWHSRSAVPCLAAIVIEGAESAAENAALTLGAMPGVPRILSEPAPPREPNGPPRSTLAAPYARWWRSAGRAAFAREAEQWEQLLQSARGPVALEPAWASP